MNNVIIYCAKYLVFVIPLLMVWAWALQSRRRKIQMIAAAILAGIIAYGLAKIAGHLHSNPRPFVSDGTPALFSHANDNGFPSEHTVLAMTLTTVLYFYWRRLAVVSLVLTSLVGWSRVAAHIHHGIDIWAAIGIGLIAGLVGYWLAKLFVRADTRAEKKVSEPAA